MLLQQNIYVFVGFYTVVPGLRINLAVYSLWYLVLIQLKYILDWWRVSAKALESKRKADKCSVVCNSLRKSVFQHLHTLPSRSQLFSPPRYLFILSSGRSHPSASTVCIDTEKKSEIRFILSGGKQLSDPAEPLTELSFMLTSMPPKNISSHLYRVITRLTKRHAGGGKQSRWLNTM